MTTITQCSVQSNLSWYNFKEFHYFVNTNRTMHACRGTPLFYYLCDVIFIRLRLQFFVFFFKRSWMCAFVSFSADSFWLLIVHFKNIIVGSDFELSIFFKKYCLCNRTILEFARMY